MTDDLRTRIAAAIAAHEPVTDYDGADGECIECDLNPRWPDAPILPPSDGWKRHADHLADAVINELGLDRQAHYDPDCPYYRYVTDWMSPTDDTAENVNDS